MKLLNNLLLRLGFVHKSQIPSWKKDFINAFEPIIMVPFNGDPVFVKVRRPTQVEIREAGDFSLIETLTDKRQLKKPTKKQIKNYAETQNVLLQKALISPTYDQLMEWIGESEFVKTANKEYEECRDLLKRTSGNERKKLENDLDDLYIAARLVMPHDFIGGVISWMFQSDGSDIKNVTEEALLEAAFLAEKGHDNPSDHLHGRFTDFNKEDINKRAWSELHKYREDKKKKR